MAHHGGNDNGRLPVTTDDFVAYGIHRGSVAPAIREAEALGFIRVTERGRGGNAEHRSPNYFFLTFAHNRNSRAEPPTHDWRRIGTLEEANGSPVRRGPTRTRERLRLASEAGASGKKAVPAKTETGSENQYRKCPVSVRKTSTGSQYKNQYYAPSTKTRTTF